MDLNGTHHFNASPDKVWAALHDGALLQTCIPGAERITWEGDSAIVAAAMVSIGPLRRHPVAHIQVTEHQAPSHMTMEGRSENVTATASVDLAPDGSGTLLTYAAHANLGGVLNPVAMLAKSFAEGQIKQVFTTLDSKIA